MKREYKDLSLEDKKEFLLGIQLAYELPYTIAIVPFIILTIVTPNIFIGVASLVIAAIIYIDYVIETKKYKQLFDL